MQSPRRYLAALIGLFCLGPASCAWAQVDFKTRTPLDLFQTMQADTVTSALYHHFAPHPEILFQVEQPVPGSGLTGHTVALIGLDFDNDGFQDILQCLRSVEGEGPTNLLINQRDGTFEVHTASGLPRGMTTAVAGDLNNDGWTDLVMHIATGGIRPDLWGPDARAKSSELTLAYAMNQQGQSFSPPILLSASPLPPLVRYLRPVLMDFNQDSYLDLAVTIVLPEDKNELHVWHGSAAGLDPVLQLPLDFPGPITLAAVDYDEDGDQDLLLQEGKFFPLQSRLLQVMINDGDSWQTARPISLPQNSHIAAPVFADVNNDGTFEIFLGVSDFDGGKNFLYFQDESGQYQDRAQEMGLWSGYNITSHATWGDWNNDGWQDALLCRNYNEGDWTDSAIFLNDAGNRFVNISDRVDKPMTPGSITALAIDIERDGDLDIILSHMLYYSNTMPLEATALKLLRNESKTGNWLAVRLQGTVSNHLGIGASVTLCADNQSWHQRLPHGVQWGLAQPAAELHFGLGNVAEVDSVLVNWPNGHREYYGPQQKNQLISLREGQGEIRPDKSSGPIRQ